jgi:predicted glycogen debranching enzyme
VTVDDRTEWLEPDGLGGFASGTTSGIRTRRYHAVLLATTAPPAGRVVLVNGFDVWADTQTGSVALSTQRYAPDSLYPDGSARIAGFTRTPWPTWEFDMPDGSRVRQELFVEYGTGVTVLSWTLVWGTQPRVLRVRPFLSGRDYHSMHHENSAFNFEPEVRDRVVVFRPYDGLPRVELSSSGDYGHAPDWYRQFLYRDERERGLDDTEDLASPGEFVLPLAALGDRAVLILRAAGADRALVSLSADDVRARAEAIRSTEQARRASFASELERSADAYLVARGSGRTIVAGYPWFVDWGRDTFIALRGLCLATGRLADARDILLEWAGAVSQGLLPNRFPDAGDAPEYNSIDASLWYTVAAHELLSHPQARGRLLSPAQRQRLESAVTAIVSGHAAGTRYGIRMDADGLLAGGVPGVQLTWMDAKVGDRVITPRIGKPVEVQALWLNALWIASTIEPRWREVFDRGRLSFGERFWSEERGYLADVIDVDHVAGRRDDTFRPNQILAAGGLPIRLVDGERARRIVTAVEDRLLTPLGLRSLAPDDPDFAARYEGGPAGRDAVYHQGTVWPWLLGPFVEAWLAVRRNTPAARREARRRFLQPLIAHLETAGLGHVSEIADAEAPYVPKGCPFQAWSLAELLRLDRQVLAEPRKSRALETARMKRSVDAAEDRGVRRVGSI